MDKETLMKYAPWLVVAMMFFMQYNLFVTPVQLEQAHREILKEIELKYTTKETSTNMKEQLSDIQHKVDKIYDILNKRGGL